MDLKALRAAAKELNEVIGLVDDDGNDIEITKKMTEDELKKILKEATSLVKPTDVLSDETQEILDELSAGDEEEEEEEEEANEEEEEEEEEESLHDKVEGADKLADLKAIASENNEFKPLRKKLNTFKKANELKEAMLDLLDDIEADEAAEKIHEKNIKNQPVRGGKGKPAPKEEEEEEEDEKPKRKGGPPKGVRPNFKKEGSMAEFMDNLVKKGGTWEELAKTCEKEGKKRELRTKFTPSTMKAHVKFRVSKDPKFLGKLKITNDGIK